MRASTLVRGGALLMAAVAAALCVDYFESARVESFAGCIIVTAASALVFTWGLDLRDQENAAARNEARMMRHPRGRRLRQVSVLELESELGAVEE